MPQAALSRNPRRNVLVVEDEPTVIKFMASVLKQEGYGMLRARDGKEAGDLFRQHAAQLALMVVNIITPSVTGTAFVESLPTLNPRIPVVFMTSGVENDPQLQAFPVLQKPFRYNDLKSKISEWALKDSDQQTS